jgi:hypothetical protein
MASGTITGTAYRDTGAVNSGIDIKIEWSSTATIASNSSSVHAALYARRNNDYTTYGTGTWTININGTTYSVTRSVSFGLSTGWYKIIENTVTVSHNTDGTKSCYIGATGGISGETSYASTVCNATVTLDTIPRGSVIGTISAFNLEDAFSVPVTKYSSSFTDTLTIKYGSTTITTVDGYTSGAEISLTDDEILAAYNAMGSALSGSFTFEITTKSGSTTIGTDSATATGTAKGTMHLKVNGEWKRAVPHRNMNGTWKRCIAYRNVSGTWQRGI